MNAPKSEFLKVLTERGFIHQTSDFDGIDAAALEGRLTTYVGYDCTGPSLHVGHLLSIMMLHWLQKTGAGKPIALMGGGTTRVGDPSRKDESRKLLTPELLSGQPMVAQARSLQLPPKLIAAFASAGAQLNTVVEAEFIASLCGLVAAGIGWALVDPLSADGFGNLGLVARPFEPAIRYEIGVFHRRDREPSMLAAAFLEKLEGKLGG